MLLISRELNVRVNSVLSVSDMVVLVLCSVDHSCMWGDPQSTGVWYQQIEAEQQKQNSTTSPSLSGCLTFRPTQLSVYQHTNAGHVIIITCRQEAFPTVYNTVWSVWWHHVQAWDVLTVNSHVQLLNTSVFCVSVMNLTTGCMFPLQGGCRSHVCCHEHVQHVSAHVTYYYYKTNTTIHSCISCSQSNDCSWRLRHTDSECLVITKC